MPRRRPSSGLVGVVAIGLALAASRPAAGAWPPCREFVRGDANLDGSLDVSDPITILLRLFSSGLPPSPCADAMDSNDDETIDVSDAIRLLGALFLRGAPPPPPYPTPGTDEACDGGDDDGDGDVDEGCPGNERDASRYEGRIAFLVSDERWEDVLRVIPAAVWRGDGSACAGGAGLAAGTCGYPVLVFHPEAESFDADASMDFLRRWRPERLRLVGPAPAPLVALLLSDPVLALTPERLERMGADDLPAHWSEVRHVVLVEQDVEAALLASSLASLWDAPLAIDGLEGGIDMEGRRVTCIGDPSGPCSERLSIDEARDRYLSETGTDRALLVRPDLDVRRTDSKPTRDGGTVTGLFGRTALPAALLAAYKRELIVAAPERDVDAADLALRSEIDRLAWSPAYLTIAASPLEIQQTIQFVRSDGRLVTWSIDSTRYGNADGDVLGFAERRTGRIYGFTTSDVSAYVARTAFHDALGFSGTHLFIGQGVGATDQRARSYAGLFERSGRPSDVNTYADPAAPDDWRGRVLLNSDAHGSQYWSTISTEQIPPLEGTLVITASCLTCAFDKLSSGSFGRLFCLQLLRNGALGAFASVDTAGFNWDSTRLNGVLSGDLGATALATQNHDHARNAWYIRDLAHSDDYGDLRADIQFLLGDPTLELPFGPPILPPVAHEISSGPDAIEVEFRIPSVNLQTDGTVFAFIEGTDDLVQARYGRFFPKAGPVELFEDYTVESGDVDPMFYGGVSVVAVQREDDGDHVHFLVEKDLSGNPLDAVVENAIRIRIVRR